MKNPTLKFAIALTLAASLGLTLSLWSQGEPEREPVAASIKWQHLALAHDTAQLGNDKELAKQINQLGREGWEMITVLNFTKEGATNNTMYYFKRPLG